MKSLKIWVIATITALYTSAYSNESMEVTMGILFSPTYAIKALTLLSEASFDDEDKKIMQAVRQEAYDFLANGESSLALSETMEFFRTEKPELVDLNDIELAAIIYTQTD